MKETRVVLDGHVTLPIFGGIKVPVHFTVDIPDGATVPVHISAIHFDGTAAANEIVTPGVV